MPTIEVEVSIKIDGALLPAFPLVRRIQTNQAQSIATQKAGGDIAGAYVVVPGCDVSPVVQAFALSADQAINLRLNGQTNGLVALNANGLLILIDGTLNAGATTNLTVNNTGVNAANLRGFEAGS